MATNKLLSQIELNNYKKIPPIERTDKPSRLKITDSLVAPIEKTDVPNYVLNTSNSKFNQSNN